MPDPRAVPPPKAPFPTTHWSRVAAAGDGDEPGARAALETLCAAYWYPLYAFARRKGLDPDAAADAVQGTFAALLARDGFARVAPERGRFRSFLMAACTHHIADGRDRDRAAKRGGGTTPIALDRRAAEDRYTTEPAHALTPERLFDRRWATGLLERAVARLESEMAAAAKAAIFARLLPALTGGPDAVPHARIAAELGLTPGAVKMAASRLRRRYGAILREEVARTVADPAEIDDEVRSLFAALAP